MRTSWRVALFVVLLILVVGSFASPAKFIPPIRRDIVVNGQTRQGYVLEWEQHGTVTTFECISENGGRPVALKLNATNVILDAPTGPSKVWGSSFWPSPQSAWGWPPPQAVDEATYTANVDESAMTVTLTGPVDARLGVRIIKSYSLDLNLGAVVHNYSIELSHTGSAPSEKTLAPWIISRVPAGGLTFYGQGSGARTSGTFAPLPVKEVDGITWFEGLPNVNDGYKLFSNASRGWLAHTQGELAFVTQFHEIDASSHAPGEAQIEIYAFGDYVEIEAQGAYSMITPAKPLTWTIRWFLRQLPHGLLPKVGNGALVDFVDRLAGPLDVPRNYVEDESQTDLPNDSHYDKPPCAADESQRNVKGILGSLCAPECTQGIHMGDACPSDKPAGVTAKPSCVLQDVYKVKYCGLLCSLDSQCDTAHGSWCAKILPPLIGVCMYYTATANSTLKSEPLTAVRKTDVVV